MCFSFEISISTFLFTYLVSIYLLSKNLKINQKQNVIFLMIFSAMQLIDAILWITDIKKTRINYMLTSFFIPFILSLQIFYNLFIINGIRNFYVYSFFFIYTILLFINFNGYTTKSKNMFSSPNWGGKEIHYLKMLCFLFLITYGRIGISGENAHSFMILFFSLLLSFYFSGGFGSIWCSLANVLSIYYLIKY